MVTTSYPRFPGDAVATFMEPIATGIARLGHRVDVVAPFTPLWQRGSSDGGVQFHLYRYAPFRGLGTFGYAAGMKADVRLRLSAMAVAPMALASGWRATRRVTAQTGATLVHAHWVIPSGVIGASARGGRPLVISLHGSDVFVAERHTAARSAARFAFGRAAWVTACSADLRDRATNLGADPARISVVPYGVDTGLFAPTPASRSSTRARLGVPEDAPLLLAVGRLVEKKGFAYLIDAAALLIREFPILHVVIAGDGALAGPLRARAAAAGLAERVILPGVIPHDAIPALLTAADVAVAPSVHDAAGNVDGLPNTVLEMMATATPLVATRVGGIGSVAADGATARLVNEQDPRALADAIAQLLRSPDRGAALGLAARALVCREYSWERVASTFSEIYDAVSGRAGAR
jgi:glycosyltransferase involved in cell wall biosynthesis